MVANIRQPWQANPVQYQQAQHQRQGPGPLQQLGQTVANKAAGTATDAGIAAGTDALLGKAAVEGGAAATQGLLGAGGSLGGGSLGASLGSALGGAGAAGLGATAAAAAPFVLGGAALGKAFGLFQDGTTGVPEVNYGPDPLGLEDGTEYVPGYADGTMSAKISKLHGEGYDAPGQAYAIAKSMGYANGTDSVPAMLTPGEAVIPAPAAQDPANQQMIQGMVEQGRAMNDGMLAASPLQQGEMMAVAGPLSGKGQREEMKLLQDMSLKKKSWMMAEQRKQEEHEQKMKMSKMKGALAMKQSQE